MFFKNDHLARLRDQGVPIGGDLALQVEQHDTEMDDFTEILKRDSQKAIYDLDRMPIEKGMRKLRVMLLDKQPPTRYQAGLLSKKMYDLCKQLDREVFVMADVVSFGDGTAGVSAVFFKKAK
jgi:hypothetical protein